MIWWEIENMGHGGKRKGAGRKPRSEAREAVTVRLEPEHAEKFRILCESKGRSQAAQITEWIKRFRLNPGKYSAAPRSGESGGDS